MNLRIGQPWEFKNKPFDSYQAADAIRCLCDCSTYCCPELPYWSEIFLKYWHIVVVLLTALLLLCIIIQYLLNWSHSPHKQNKCLYCEGLSEDPDSKFEDDDSKSTKNLTLSSIVTKY